MLVKRGWEAVKVLREDGDGHQHPRDCGAAPRNLRNHGGFEGRHHGREGVFRAHSITGTTKKRQVYGKMLLKSDLMKLDG